MKRTIVYVLYAIPLILYTLSVAFLMNQPIELINPFEYYNEFELPTLSLYIMMILFISLSMFGFILGNRCYMLSQISYRTIIIFAVLSFMICLFITRMSVLPMIAVALMFLKRISQKQLSQQKLLSFTISIYASFTFVIIIPVIILFRDYESFLNVKAFQEFIAINHQHQAGKYILLNIDYFVQHTHYYIAAFILCIIPGVLTGMYHQKNVSTSNIFIQSLMALIAGTSVKLLIFKFSFGFLQYLLLILGASLQGLGLVLIIFICIRYFDELTTHPLKQTKLYIGMVVLIDVIIYSLFTGIGKLPYPASSLIQLLQHSLIVALVVSVVYIVLSLWIEKSKNNDQNNTKA
ncbi:hypothetical protein ACMGE6_00640 [Macrococcus equi]|uniref:hypothetical protein n=1 Tax=Macrococcus equi TaxID=3395462 RepID=UPI0039BDF26D